MKKIIIILIVLWSQTNLAQTPLGNYFTYQGELLANGQVANGNYEFEAQFYDAATNGNNVGNNFNITATVTDGIFTLQLDIGGGAFEGDEVWIALLVTPPGGGTQVSLLPRQLITNSPYSIQAKYVGNDGVSTISIINAAVTTSKLANAAVTSAKLAGDSVTSAKIANGTIETIDISSQAVTRVQIASNTIQRSEVDSTQIQERVIGTCAAGSSIRIIAQDGSVTCETDDTGGSAGWGLTGNAGTNPATNFIGTVDVQDLSFKVNNGEALRLTRTGNVLFQATEGNTIASSKSSILGGEDNTISSFYSAIVSGSTNSITSENSGVSNYSVISGGSDNKIDGNVANSQYSVISGGNVNNIKGYGNFIGSGTGNKIIGRYSVVPGGNGNEVTGDFSAVTGGSGNKISSNYSFSGGFGSKVNHTGSWVWNDYSDTNQSTSFATTADN